MLYLFFQIKMLSIGIMCNEEVLARIVKVNTHGNKTNRLNVFYLHVIAMSAILSILEATYD
jgi:hypothetical protein